MKQSKHGLAQPVEDMGRSEFRKVSLTLPGNAKPRVTETVDGEWEVDFGVPMREANHDAFKAWLDSTGIQDEHFGDKIYDLMWKQSITEYLADKIR